MKRLALLVLLAFCVVLTNADCDPYRESFESCSRDDRCRFHMYIDANPDDMDSYSEVVNYHPTAKKYIGATFCSEDGTELAKRLWIESTYQSHGMCDDPNEIYVRDIGCICRQGRRCNVKSALDHVLGINRHDTFILVLALGFVGSFAYLLTRTQTNTTIIESLQKEKRDADKAAALRSELSTRSSGPMDGQKSVASSSSNFVFFPKEVDRRR